jgi:hypothetical protein
VPLAKTLCNDKLHTAYSSAYIYLFERVNQRRATTEYERNAYKTLAEIYEGQRSHGWDNVTNTRNAQLT